MAGNRCDSCGTMVSLETGEPEVQSEELNEGVVTVEVRLTRDCAGCGGEMKETYFNLEVDHSLDLAKHIQDTHPELVSKNGTDEHVDFSQFSLDLGETDTDESGGGRFKKNMISLTVGYTIACGICGTDVISDSITDTVAASGFDEC